MIRQTRWLSVRNNCSVFLFTQRAAFLPKLNSLEFCVASNPEEVPKNKNSSKCEMPVINTVEEPLVKFSILKDVLKGCFKGRTLDPFEKETHLQEFLQNVVNYPASDIIRILKIFAETNNRALPILKSLCDVLLIKNAEYTEWECSDILYSLSKLSYRYEPVIKLVVNQLKMKKHFQSVSAMKSILHSFAELRYRDCQLLENILQYMMNISYDIKTAVDVLISFSYLNFSPPQIDHLIKVLANFENTDFPQTKDYINFVWACVILNRLSFLSEKHLFNVLSESFLEQLDKGMKGVIPGFKLKLLNINAAAALLPYYKGPVLNDLPQYKSLHPPLSNKSNTFMESLKDSLSYIVAQGSQMEFFVHTGSGIFIDIQLSLDLKDWPSLKKKKKDEIKLGVILLNYSDLCSDYSLSGVSAFKLNILRRLGHMILPVPYHEYPLNSKLSEKIFYLRNLIKNLANDSNNSTTKKT